ncbi:uncharacterized protein LOC128219208 [Mya arenaria]|uniref:uncharacterized protein LOC128219208 n=1 Tax=Mya arenaria TaxID=6604 RepID=UPI0022DFAC87|nr:uncharacterized protein LOC128219208 [Mya arenaria]
MQRKKTGSGAIKLSPAEEVLADHLRDVNPRQIDGIPGGVDTYVTVSSVPEVNMPYTPTEDVTVMPLVFSVSAVHETASPDQLQPPVSCPGTSRACDPAEALENSFVYDSPTGWFGPGKLAESANQRYGYEYAEFGV